MSWLGLLPAESISKETEAGAVIVGKPPTCTSVRSSTVKILNVFDDDQLPTTSRHSNLTKKLKLIFVFS